MTTYNKKGKKAKLLLVKMLLSLAGLAVKHNLRLISDEEYRELY